MTRVAERFRDDEEFLFVREVGRVWHVAQPEVTMNSPKIQAECSVVMRGPYTKEKQLQFTSNPFGLGDCCTRRGCKDAFDYVDLQSAFKIPESNV